MVWKEFLSLLCFSHRPIIIVLHGIYPLTAKMNAQSVIFVIAAILKCIHVIIVIIVVVIFIAFFRYAINWIFIKQSILLTELVFYLFNMSANVWPVCLVTLLKSFQKACFHLRKCRVVIVLWCYMLFCSCPNKFDWLQIWVVRRCEKNNRKRSVEFSGPDKYSPLARFCVFAISFLEIVIIAQFIYRWIDLKEFFLFMCVMLELPLFLLRKVDSPFTANFRRPINRFHKRK